MVEQFVFINCPFTLDYLERQRALLFITLAAGCEPLLTLEDGDGAKGRIDKLWEMIGKATLSIHDLSFCTCKCVRKKGKKEIEYHRFNMPYELGIAYTLKRQADGLKSNTPKPSILLLEENSYDLQKALSDVNAFDPKSYDGDLQRLFKIVRDWFYQTGLKNIATSASLYTSYASFKKKTILDYESEFTQAEAIALVNEMSATELKDKMRVWLGR